MNISIKVNIDGLVFCIQVVEEDGSIKHKLFSHGNRGDEEESTDYVFSMDGETEGCLKKVGMEEGRAAVVV